GSGGWSHPSPNPAAGGTEIDGTALARQVAARSFTLLRNEGGLLPLGGVRSVALIGSAAGEARVVGGGSAQVFPDRIVSPLEGLRGRGNVEPGGRLPTTWPVRQSDVPVLNVTPAGGKVAYDEGLFIGYRAWERAGVLVRPRTGLHDLVLRDTIAVTGTTVTVAVTDTGRRAGREVVRFYSPR
ncbi:glycoside hydrolase family 3 C-terminal domain-containing protein, partial [Streptosporangium minutum]